MEDVEVEEVKWLIYPFIPYGKITIIQGDPGEGKTTLVLQIIARLTKGESIVNEEAKEPINVIYQTAEDGLADTIKPRLLSADADCSKVLVIDDKDTPLRAAERNDYMARVWYTKEFDSLIDIIKCMYCKSFTSESQLNEFIANGGWKARKNGRDIDIQTNYVESTSKDVHSIKITNAKTSWKEWIKTIGVLLTDASPYKILCGNEQYEFKVVEQDENIEVWYDASLSKQNPLFIKLLKNVFRKAACCVKCRECEADCH